MCTRLPLVVVVAQDLEEMAGRAVRLLLFKSHEKPKEVVARKKVNDAMSEGCRDNPKLIKLMPVALAMAQVREGHHSRDTHTPVLQHTRFPVSPP